VFLFLSHFFNAWISGYTGDRWDLHVNVTQHSRWSTDYPTQWGKQVHLIFFFFPFFFFLFFFFFFFFCFCVCSFQMASARSVVRNLGRPMALWMDFRFSAFFVFDFLFFLKKFSAPVFVNDRLILIRPYLNTFNILNTNSSDLSSIRRVRDIVSIDPEYAKPIFDFLPGGLQSPRPKCLLWFFFYSCSLTLRPVFSSS